MTALPVIGYALLNRGAVLIHAVDYTEGYVTASINGKGAARYKMTQQNTENGWEPGIRMFGSFFLPFSSIIRME